jgi:hypothetical protein
MPSPPGDLELLVRSVQASPSLLGFAKVLRGKNALTASGAPFRVAMYVVGADNGVADVPAVSVSSAWMLLTAHFWSPDDGSAFDLRTRWFQAMKAQADAGGYFWKMPDGRNEHWDTKPDSSEQGQEFEIDVLIRVDVDKPTKSTGTVQATSLNRVFELTTPLGASDTTAVLEAAYELPPSGIGYVDDEQFSYSGTTANTLTGLVRGLNRTTAAAHASGTPVYVTPS